jgi:hypothetical protein
MLLRRVYYKPLESEETLCVTVSFGSIEATLLEVLFRDYRYF